MLRAMGELFEYMDPEELEVRRRKRRRQARLRAGLRSALRTECSALHFQGGGRGLSWFWRHFYNEEKPFLTPLPVVERARLLWCGHHSLLSEHWEPLHLRWVGWYFLARVLRERTTGRGAGMDMALVEGVARWMMEHSTLTRTVFCGPWLESVSHNGKNFKAICVKFISWAMLHDWDWFLDALQELHLAQEGATREDFHSLLFVGAVGAGDIPRAREYMHACDSRLAMPVRAALGRAGPRAMAMLEFLESEPGLFRKRLTAQTRLIVREASEHGNLLFLEQLSRYCAAPTADDVSSGAAIPVAARARGTVAGGARHEDTWHATAMAGHADVLRWLHNQGGQPVGGPATAAPWMEVALAYGRLEVVKFLHEDLNYELPPNDGPLQGLVRRSPKSTLACLEYVLARGALDRMASDAVIRMALLTHQVRVDVLDFLGHHVPRPVWKAALQGGEVTSGVETLRRGLRFMGVSADEWRIMCLDDDDEARLQQTHDESHEDDAP